jgi:serralysin
MMLDLAAIQELYGVNYSTLAGNTTYTFDPNTGEMFIDGVGQGTPGANRVFRTLWDGNGTDLIDLSNYTTDLSIDLNAGAGIDLDVGGYAQRAMLSVSNQIFASKHVYMSLLHNNDTRSLIENATGGTGNDILVGNQAANVLQGGAGDDVVGGGLGNDTLTLGSGADTVADTLAGLNGDVVTDFNAAEDTVRVTGTILNLAQISINSAGGLEIDTDGDGTVEALLSLGLDPNAAVTVSHQGNDSVISFGATVDLPPVVADDPLNLNGGNGDDTLTGGTGDDSILVRYGSDTATGNAGADTFILDWRYVNTGDHHTITDLDFSEGDTLQVRFFGGRKHDIGTDAELSAFVARADVTSVQTSSGLDITLTESNGPSLTVSLEGALISAPTVTDLTLNGGNNDDTLIGGAGDDTILMRFGSDTATGNAGADTFAFDWRYVNAGDHHTITDLDFSEGDTLQVRFFGGQNHSIGTDAELSAFVARADVTSVQTSSGLDITLTDSSGPSLTFSLEGNLGTTSAVTSDPDLTLNGGNNDDTLIGGAGDDTILMRFGSDTATGDAGADTFAFDWRYVNAGDRHTITDLDFSEGDTLQVRFFGGQNHNIGTDAELSAFVARADVTSVQTSNGLDITLTDSSGPSLTFQLSGWDNDLA